MSETLTIVIPAYNEESRLPRTLQELKVFATTLQGFSLLEVIVVDDGSQDQTSATVEGFANTWSLLKCLRLPQNRGKGGAVHAGLKAAQGEWVLIADADMATPWKELQNFADLCADYDLVMGSRALKESHIVIRQHWLRQNMGRTFNRLLKSLVRLPYHDTQCGFKLIRNDQVFRNEILPKLSVQRFAWDVELLLFLRKYQRRILETPVQWSHQEASRVRIVRDSFEMLLAVLRLRIRGL